LTEALALGLEMAGPVPEVERVVTLTLYVYARPLSVELIQEVRNGAKRVIEAIDREFDYSDEVN
jgi:hypothetical protein